MIAIKDFFLNSLDESLFKTICKVVTLRENCPNTELFQVRIFLYSDWIQENADQK